MYPRHTLIIFITLLILTNAAIACGYIAQSSIEALQWHERISLKCAVKAPLYVRKGEIFGDLEQIPITE